MLVTASLRSCFIQGVAVMGKGKKKGRKGEGGPKPSTPSDDTSSQQSVPGPSQSDFPSLGETVPQHVEPAGKTKKKKNRYHLQSLWLAVVQEKEMIPV